MSLKSNWREEGCRRPNDDGKNKKIFCFHRCCIPLDYSKMLASSSSLMMFMMFDDDLILIFNFEEIDYNFQKMR